MTLSQVEKHTVKHKTLRPKITPTAKRAMWSWEDANTASSPEDISFEEAGLGSSWREKLARRALKNKTMKIWKHFGHWAAEFWKPQWKKV